MALIPWDRVPVGVRTSSLALPSAPPLPVAPAASKAERSAARIVPFEHAMPLPPVLSPVSRTDSSDVYRLRMAETQTEIVKGLLTTVQSYGGCFPGPTIRAVRGREVVVQQTNDLGVNTAVHLHGGHVRSQYDGLPMDIVKPGETREYHYPNDQPAASLWYHDHAHQLEAENVYRGLAGAYLLSDPHESGLPLPAGEFDIPLLFRDARIEADGRLVYTSPYECPHMLVNGKERPYFEVAARKYRLRLFNVSPNRHITLRLPDGVPFIQIASDAGLLAGPVEVHELTLAGAERAEVVVDFARYPVGSSVVLENTAALESERSEVLRFDITRAAEDQSRVPDVLATLPPIPKATVHREFDLTTFPDTRINGRKYDPDRTDVRTTVGSSEIWTIHNRLTRKPAGVFHAPHSFHTHLVRFRVLDRNGKAVGPAEAGFKDTVVIHPGEYVRIAMTWGDYEGQYVYHCHHMVHSSHGQMGRIDVLPAGSEGPGKESGGPGKESEESSVDSAGHSGASASGSGRRRRHHRFHRFHRLHRAHHRRGRRHR
ncbi:multicopper oxidase family protein [Streptomyces sp. FH025]|uniref:multicopper oxidase family protein n=1 Tax=Streptomyces sp. FH025 TaxID=2815937 RepID=UPI001A9FE02A|nr:multicopper oxidase family protein [Streptomyces sp. FH025]MBO1416091.1 multicopper oxidase family protein [Streptomyces sp. FH025]